MYKHLQILGDQRPPAPLFSRRPAPNLMAALLVLPGKESLRFPTLFRVEFSYFLEYMYGVSKDITIVMYAISVLKHFSDYYPSPHSLKPQPQAFMHRLRK